MKNFLLSASALAVAVTLSGCVTTGNNSITTSEASVGTCQYNTALYVAGGAALGLAVAKILGVNNKEGLIASAAIGGALGKGTQSYLTQRCREIEALNKQMKSTEVVMRPITVARRFSQQTPEKTKETGIALTVSSNSMFKIGSAHISASAEPDMKKLARTFRKTKRKVLIIGHTDSTGSTVANQDLSERRAQAVAKIFVQEGIPKTSLYYKGAGDTRPIATNRTVAGRAKNRRVEVVELKNEQDIVAFDRTVNSNPAVLSQTTPERTDIVKVPPKAAVPNKAAAPNTVTAPPQQTAVASLETPPTNPAKALHGGTSLDFGGQVVNGTGANLMAHVGKKKKGFFSSFTIINKAFASDKPAPLLKTACIADVYRNISPVKSYSTGKDVLEDYNAMDYMPGLYISTWTDTVNKHLVGLTKISVLRDGSNVNQKPEMFIFKDYTQGDQTPTLQAKAEVRTYIGKDGILYRAFFGKKAWPIRCMDIVFSRKNAGTASTGTLYYDKGGKVYAAQYMPKFINKNTNR